MHKQKYSYEEYIKRRNKILIILMCIVGILIVLFATFHPHYYRLTQYRPATCTEAGYAHYECWCKESYTENYPATGHNYMIYKKNATCESEGYIEYICSVCQHKKKEVIPKIDHDFIVTREEPTCSREGNITHTCKNCGYTYSETLEMIDHEYIDGKCKYCGKVNESYKAQAEQPKPKKSSNENSISSGTELQITYPQLPAVVVIDNDAIFED